MDVASGEFTEDTHTVLVNRAGARIVLRHAVSPGDSLRIINLENYSEADFRVVGPTQMPGIDPPEWGIECSEPERSIWGIKFSPPQAAGEGEAGTMIACRACGNQLVWLVSPMEAEVLDSTGAIAVDCPHCGKLTYWTYADAKRIPPGASIPESVASALKPESAGAQEHRERRQRKRLALKMRALVRNMRCEEEVSYTENVSKSGLAVSLAMNLSVGESVTIVCPYTEGDQQVEQKARVKWRCPFPSGPRRIYGLSYQS